LGTEKMNKNGKILRDLKVTIEQSKERRERQYQYIQETQAQRDPHGDIIIIKLGGVVTKILISRILMKHGINQSMKSKFSHNNSKFSCKHTLKLALF
jgi:hypothetical protein